jgi:hypothetical protein
MCGPRNGERCKRGFSEVAVRIYRNCVQGK